MSYLLITVYIIINLPDKVQGSECRTGGNWSDPSRDP